MKQKIILIFAIVLFLAFIAWVLADLFQTENDPKVNPFDYGMQEIRKQDTLPQWKEIRQLKPALAEITCLATDKAGRIYISGNGGVEILAPDGKPLNRFSIPGNATALFCLPDGNLLIGLEDHIEIWNPSGVRLVSFESPDSATLFTSVTATTTDIYAADAGKKVVYQYDRNGNITLRIGEKDPARKIPGFIIPSPFFDLGISPRGDLWVVNPGRHTFEKYSHDGSLLSSWGETSFTTEGFSGCCNPSHFAFLPDGSFVTSEKGIERIKVYGPDGTFTGLVAGPDSFDEGTRGLDLATGPGGEIIVLDPSRHQVRIFVSRNQN